MIYSSALNVKVKNAFRTTSMQSNIGKIASNLTMDPDITNMDVVFLGPEDAKGRKAPELISALNNVHPDICVMYVYTKDSDEGLFNVPYKHKCKRITEKELQAAFDKYAKDHMIRQGKGMTSSADFTVMTQKDEAAPIDPSIASAPKFDPNNIGRGLSNAVGEFEKARESQFRPHFDPNAANNQQQQSQPEPPTFDTTGPKPLGESALHNLMETEVGKGVDTEPEPVQEVVPVEPPTRQEFVPEPMDIPVPDIGSELKLDERPLDSNPRVSLAKEDEVPVAPRKTPTVEDRVDDYIKHVRNPEEWKMLTEHLRHDSIVSSLIAENAEYSGLVQMLDVLDQRIQAIYRDPSITVDDKFNQIKDIGMERATVRASTNSANVDKALSIISAIIVSAKNAVDEKVNNIDRAMYKIRVDRAYIEDTAVIDKAIGERSQVLIDMLNLGRDIVDLYKSISNLVTAEIEELDNKLPSANAFINNMVNPIGTEIFTPVNSAALANKMLEALRNHSVTVSQMEEKVNSLIEYLFELFNKDQEIIEYQREKIAMLTANRVEDFVVTPTLIKKVMRLYIGASNTGVTATALTWSGVLSRRGNVLLIDLSGEHKLEDYGIKPVPLKEFMDSYLERQLLCVSVDEKITADEVPTLIHSISQRLNYYMYVNVILPTNDLDVINQFAEDAKAIHYVTDCSTMSMATLKMVVDGNNVTNIARNLVTIDAPVSPLTIANNVGIDATMCKFIPIPKVPAIRACAIRHDRPFDYTDVVKIFEEAFS